MFQHVQALDLYASSEAQSFRILQVIIAECSVPLSMQGTVMGALSFVKDSGGKDHACILWYNYVAGSDLGAADAQHGAMILCVQQSGIIL